MKYLEQAKTHKMGLHTTVAKCGNVAKTSEIHTVYLLVPTRG